MGRRSDAGAFVAALALAGSQCACTSQGETNRFGRHFDTDPWAAAFEQNFTEPREWGPEVAFLIATPILHAHDDELSQQLRANHAITGSDTKSGDVVMGALAVGSAGLAGWNWIEGDHAESLEVAAESFALTGLATSGLKRAVGRPRPNDGPPTSFPSGHASFSFAASTFLARSVWDTPEPTATTETLGWLCYVPAAWVGLNRVETGHHFPSDVSFGALLGITTTNLVWDAHFAQRGESGATERIFSPGHSASVSLFPLLTENGTALDLQIRF
jgi:hypothetical protein